MARSVAKRAAPEADVLEFILAFYSAGTAVDRAHAAELGPHELSINQWHVLNVLYRNHEPMAMRDLSEAISMRPTNLTGVVDSLVKRRLLERSPNMEDRRSWLVHVSAEGRRFLEEFLPSHWGYLRKLTAGLSSAELRQLKDLLTRLKSSIDVASAANNGGSPTL